MKNIDQNSVILDAKDITKTFSTGQIQTEVLKGVSLVMKKGEFVAIVGESGSGKSTLLYILAGIEQASSGTVSLLGQDIQSLTDKQMSKLRRTKFSFVYQSNNLVDNLTAYENIALPLLLDKKSEKEFRPQIIEICDYLGILDRLKNYPNEMSGGEQQRVAIARALATNPEIIFLDEPTGSLDKDRGLQVMQLLNRINRDKGVALLMVTHSESHSKFADRIVRMEDGKII